MARTREPVNAGRPMGAYTPGMVVGGRLVFVSGQGPVKDGRVVGNTVEEQTRITLENLFAVLAAAGAGPCDVIRCGVYLADLADFPVMDRVYAEHFPEPRPARTTAGAALRDIRVEIDCVAVLPD